MMSQRWTIASSPDSKRKQSDLEKDEILDLLGRKSDRITLSPVSANKFCSYERVKIHLQFTDYVTCVQCHSVQLFKYKSGNGSHGLDYHLENHDNASNQDETLPIEFSVSSKKQDNTCCCQICVIDSIPFNIIKEKG